MSLSSDRMKDKVCVVTGAAKSIGYGIAKKFAEQNAKVILLDIDPKVIESARELTAAGMNATGFICDITNRKEVLELFDKEISKIGSVYCLINNAGVVDQRPFEENTEEIFQRMFNVNVNGTAWCIQGALPSMKQAGEGGRIINFSSKSGKTGSALMAPYSAAKGAIIALTHSLAFELAPYKINVNCICPGITGESGVWANVSSGYVKNLSMSKEEIIGKFTDKIPLKRLADISDVVEYVFFLAAEGDYCTGQAVNISGGREVH
jgi:Dehydrogenases with different specificities (related to short-chain alcohol dehydrogenases)